MEVGALPSTKWKIGRFLRRDVQSMMKGGDEMSEIRKSLAELMTKVMEGKIPLDTAEVVHKAAHRHIMDRYADDREARRMGEEKMAERLGKAQEVIKSL